MNPRFFDWIWHIKGSLALGPGQSSDEVFDRLDPLFRETGTSHERQRESLAFSKKDPGSQDKMSVFDNGVLWIEQGVTGAVLRYQLTSRALLCCFLAPLLFLAFAQIGLALSDYQKASAEADGREADAAEKSEEKDEVQPLHWIDQALGAPAPETPDEKKKDKAEEEEEDEGFSPTPAYVFAGLFAILYIVGRVLEDRLIKSQFRKRLRAA